MTSRRFISCGLGALALMAAASLGACRSPDELAKDISAVVIVIDIDDNQLVELSIDGQTLSQSPKSTDNVVAFSLRLDPGTYQGNVVVFEVKDEDDGERLEPKACGGFALVIPEDADDVVTLAIDHDEFEDCPEDDDDDRARAADDGADDDGADDDGADDGADGNADDGADPDAPDDGADDSVDDDPPPP